MHFQHAHPIRCVIALSLVCLLSATKALALPSDVNSQSAGRVSSNANKIKSKAGASDKATTTKPDAKAKNKTPVKRKLKPKTTSPFVKPSVNSMKTSQSKPLPRVEVALQTPDQGNDEKKLIGAGLEKAAPRILNLSYLLEQASQAHPTLQAARLDVRASGEDLQVAQRQRWPTVSAVLENKSSNTTVSSTQALRLEQNLWDGGRTSARILEAEANISVNETRVHIQNQTLSLQIVNAWQNLLAADGRIQVARDTLSQLDKYSNQMRRRVTADVSSPIDLKLAQSRILQTEVELSQALNSRQVALGKLEQYSGVEGLSQLQQRPPAAPGLKQTEQAAISLIALDWSDVASRHPDVQKARQESLVAQQRIEAKKAEQWPQIYFRLDKPLGSTNNDPTGFFGLRYTPGAGLSSGIEAQALASRAASQAHAIDTATRNVLEALHADRDELMTSRTRMSSLDESVQGSRAVLESYGRQFSAGRKTWQDLMNAVRELAQIQYSLVDTHAAMVGAMYRLQIRTGQSLHPVE
jgi:adhesin transport system outer membrane protein